MSELDLFVLVYEYISHKMWRWNLEHKTESEYVVTLILFYMYYI